MPKDRVPVRRTLTQLEKTALRLVVDGHSISEIAKRFDMAQSEVRVLIETGLKKIKTGHLRRR